MVDMNNTVTTVGAGTGSAPRKTRAKKWDAYCLQCCGGGKDLTGPTTRKQANWAACSHASAYGCRVIVREV